MLSLERAGAISSALVSPCLLARFTLNSPAPLQQLSLRIRVRSFAVAPHFDDHSSDIPWNLFDIHGFLTSFTFAR